MVTGAASGIGRGIAFRLAEMGTFVAVLDIDEDKGRATATEIEARGGAAVFLKCDVRSAADCRQAVDTIIEQDPARSISFATAPASPSAKTSSISRKTSGTSPSMSRSKEFICSRAKLCRT